MTECTPQKHAALSRLGRACPEPPEGCGADHWLEDDDVDDSGVVVDEGVTVSGELDVVISEDGDAEEGAEPPSDGDEDDAPPDDGDVEDEDDAQPTGESDAEEVAEAEAVVEPHLTTDENDARVFARYSVKQAQRDPAAWSKFERSLRVRHKAKHPDDELLRIQSANRKNWLYLTGGT